MLGPLVIWSFVGTGLYASRVRPESRTGALMVLLGFAWCVPALSFANPPLVYTFALVAGGLWGGVFLQLLMTFPSGRIASGRDRAVVLAGYLVFTVAGIPALLFAGQRELSCDDCPDNLLLVRHDQDLADLGFGLQSALFALLLVVVLVRLGLRWSRTPPLERLQLTPVYVCGLLTFLLVTAGTASGTTPCSGARSSRRAAADRVPRRPAAQPRRAARRRAARPAGGAARVARAAGSGRGRRAPAARARPPRRRPVAARRARADARPGPAADRHDAGAAALLERARGRAEHEPRRAARARARHPSACLDRARARARAARARRPRARAGRARHRRRGAPAPAGRDRRLLHRRRGAHQRREVRPRDRGERRGAPDGRPRDDRDQRRRGRRRRPRTPAPGLRGLGDRVAALEGSLAVDSPPGGGTRLVAELPCRAAG